MRDLPAERDDCLELHEARLAMASSPGRGYLVAAVPELVGGDGAEPALLEVGDGLADLLAVFMTNGP